MAPGLVGDAAGLAERWQQLVSQVIANHKEVVIYDIARENHDACGEGNERRLHKLDKNSAMVTSLKRYFGIFQKVKASLLTSLGMRTTG